MLTVPFPVPVSAPDPSQVPRLAVAGCQDLKPALTSRVVAVALLFVDVVLYGMFAAWIAFKVASKLAR